MNIPKPSPIGHNVVTQLRNIIERIEKFEEDRASIAADIRDIMREAKGNGFDTKAIKAILKLRQLNAAERDEQEALLDTYKRALGMLSGADDERI